MVNMLDSLGEFRPSGKDFLTFSEQEPRNTTVVTLLLIEVPDIDD